MTAVGRAFYLSCALAAAAGVAPAQTATEIVLHNFVGPQKGANPQSGVLRDAAGNLYGTTVYGGPANAGVVYKVAPGGRLIVLYNFTGGADGAYPYAGVIADSAGNLYGTTAEGGVANWGVVYKLDNTGKQTVLHSFTGDDGALPYAGVIRDSSGNLYGTTASGGPAGSGVLYKLDPAGRLTVLHGFRFASGDGAMPMAGVIRDAAGNFYGTTLAGGASAWDSGTVYKVDPAGRFTLLHSFTGGEDGASPYSGVIRDSAGNLYGTTWDTIVYKLDPGGVVTVLHKWTAAGDPKELYAGVIRDAAGNLYGTGCTGGAANRGVVYKLDPEGRQTALYTFTGGADGDCPYAGLILDAAGNLYGTTRYAGTAHAGVVYRVDPAGQQTVLSYFPSSANGAVPQSGVIDDSAGNLYGTTAGGGTSNQGVVYKLDPSGHETLLYSFTGGADGGGPWGVIRDAAGNLYGTTTSGGTANSGVVFKLDPSGRHTVLYPFTGGADGGTPSAGVIGDAAGNLYGTTTYGGATGSGVVYKLDSTGHQSVLHTFTGGGDGGYPRAGVIGDPDGNLYGTTWGGGTQGCGVVYKLDVSGSYTVLYSFTCGADGGLPYQGVIRDSAGNLYGTTLSYGAHNAGVVYKLDPARQLTVLYNFTGGADGGRPNGNGLVRDAAGNLYGTTYFGGLTDQGVVFQLDPSGVQTVLHSFTGGDDGGHPSGALRGANGFIYGATLAGGRRNTGVVFKLKLQ